MWLLSFYMYPRNLPIIIMILTKTSIYTQLSFLSPRISRKRGTLKLICTSVHQSVRLSVTKTLTWLISSEVLMIEH